MENLKYYRLLEWGIFSLFIIVQSCGTPTESDNSKARNYTENVVGRYSTGGITQNFFKDSTVKVSMPGGNYEYKWQIVDANENFIKISEIHEDYNVNFILYSNSSKYPIKVKNCLQESSSFKYFSGQILIPEKWLENSSCEGLYFGKD